MSRGEITVEELNELLQYDPNTGEFRWKVKMSPRAMPGSIAGCICCEGYRVIRIRRTGYKAHRLAIAMATGKMPEAFVDHINRVRDDNRLENLRQAEPYENSQNIGARRNGKSTSQLVGAAWSSKHRKWKASIRLKGKQIHIGYFSSPEESHSAYIKKKRELHHFGGL